MKIREATKKDVLGVYPLFLELIKSEENFFRKSINFFDKLGKRKKEFEKNSKTELLKDIENRNSILLVAEEDDKIIGYISGNFVDAKNPFYDSIMLGYLKHIIILKEYQKKGISKELSKRLDDWFKEKKCNFVYLEVFSVNPVVRKFRKLGYNEVTNKMWKKLK